MASPGLAISIEAYEAQSELYFSLWRQLEVFAPDAKWLEMRPEGSTVLQKRVRTAIQRMAPDKSTALYLDQKTQDFLRSGTGPNTEVASFREYLRDTALRFAQVADSLLD